MGTQYGVMPLPPPGSQYGILPTPVPRVGPTTPPSPSPSPPSSPLEGVTRTPGYGDIPTGFGPNYWTWVIRIVAVLVFLILIYVVAGTSFLTGRKVQQAASSDTPLPPPEIW